VQITKDLVLNILNTILDKGDNAFIVTMLCIIISILIYFIHDILKYKVLHKQMSVFMDRILPIIEDIKTSYALELQTKLHNGTLHISSIEFVNVVNMHCNMVDAVFAEGEKYMRCRLLENHVAAPSEMSCPQDNCLRCTREKCRGFKEYSYGTYNAFNGLVLGEYKQRYNSKFFQLSIASREEVLNSRFEDYYKEWCKMIRVFHEISKNRWKLK